MNGKQIIKKLQEAGFSVIRVNGSHHFMASADKSRRTTVPVHGTKDLKPKTLQAIETQSGVKLK